MSPRHLSFVETDRSRPSPDVLLNLAARLEVPLRERYRMLLAAGYAPVYEQHALDDPEMPRCATRSRSRSPGTSRNRRSWWTAPGRCSPPTARLALLVEGSRRSRSRPQLRAGPILRRMIDLGPILKLDAVVTGVNGLAYLLLRWVRGAASV